MAGYAPWNALSPAGLPPGVPPSALTGQGEVASQGRATWGATPASWGATPASWGATPATTPTAITAAEYLAGRRTPLDAEQLRNASLILEQVALAGYGPEIGLAAVTNAKAESDLRANAIGDGGHSVGLFQTSDTGAGKGLSVAARQDPLTNLDLILDELGRVRSSVLSAHTPKTATAAFCKYVERPVNADTKAQERAALCESLFPAWANVDKTVLPAVSVPVTTQIARRFPFGWVGVGVVVAGVAWYLLRGRR